MGLREGGLARPPGQSLFYHTQVLVGLGEAGSKETQIQPWTLGGLSMLLDRAE